MTPNSTTRPEIRVREIEFRILPTRTRFPFKYGIASMTEVPHLFAGSLIEVNGKVSRGLASEGLPPKWFTKNPETRFEEDDLPQMMEVIKTAADIATDADSSFTFFELWQHVYGEQSYYAATNGIPPLLANLGVSLIERTVLDALCRSLDQPLSQLVHGNVLAIELCDIYQELGGSTLSDMLPAKLPDRITARHTVGLADPLLPADICDDERADDGLPQALTDCIAAYGLTHFKIKLCGDAGKNIPRLEALAEILLRVVGQDLRFSLDGNEQFSSMVAFREHWERYRENPDIRPLLDHLLFVEQPLHRDAALEPEVATEIESWADAPPIIIDESDGAIDDVRHALDLGYAGTSHKNCKGIVKGIANAALLNWRRQCSPDQTHILSGEDLCNIGPVALLQDLAMMRLLGITHVERNGHHYMKGLSAFPESIQQKVIANHGDLYYQHADGYATLRIENGMINLSSISEAPFGLHPLIDIQSFDLA